MHDEEDESKWLRQAGVEPPRMYPDLEPKQDEPKRSWWQRFKRWYQARFRTNLEVVCEMSKGKGLVDYHDYPDTELGVPFHMGTDFCKRCGKEFTM